MHNVQRLRSPFVLLVLALLLAAPWTVEARPSEAHRAEATASPIHLFLDWVASLWGDNGCSFDPNGGGCRYGAGSTSPSGTDGLDNGCSFDPGGGSCHENG